MLKKWLEKRKKRKLLNKACKTAEDPVWFVFYESNGESGTVEVFANKESVARELAKPMIEEIVQGTFTITGTAAI